MDASIQHVSIFETLDQPAVAFETVAEIYRELESAFTNGQDLTVEWLLDALSRKHRNVYLVHYLQAKSLEFISRCASSWTTEYSRHVFGFNTPFLAFDEMNLIGRIRRLIDRQEELYGAMPHTEIARGAIHFLQADVKPAMDHFGRGACLSDNTGLKLQRMCVGAYSASSDPVHSPQLTPEATRFNIRRQHRGRGITLLVGADMRYLCHFGRGLVESTIGTGIGVHFHIINPAEDIHEHVPPDCGLSVEYIEMGSRSDITWYTLVRFARARLIQEAYSTPLLISDIDGVLAADINFVDRAVRSADVTFNARRGHASHVPWRILHGTGTLVANTSGGRTFLTALEQLIRDRYPFGQYPRTWWFDQLALFQSAMLALGQGVSLASFEKNPFRTAMSPDDKKMKQEARLNRALP